MEITREETFDMAHRLMQHDGQCSNIHGHTYRVQVTVAGVPDKETGMVIDFSTLKEIMHNTIIDPLDHALALNEGDGLVGILEKMGYNIVTYKGDPTVELMSFDILKKIKKYIDGLVLPNFLEVTSVRLWETPKCFATARKNDLNER